MGVATLVWQWLWRQPPDQDGVLRRFCVWAQRNGMNFSQNHFYNLLYRLGRSPAYRRENP